jgi:hypothetical protein
VQVEFGRADDEDIPDGGADAESGDGTDVESTDHESEE